MINQSLSPFPRERRLLEAARLYRILDRTRGSSNQTAVACGYAGQALVAAVNSNEAKYAFNIGWAITKGRQLRWAGVSKLTARRQAARLTNYTTIGNLYR